MNVEIKSPTVDETAGWRLKTNSLAAEYVSAFKHTRIPLYSPYLQPNFTQYFKARISIYHKEHYGMLFKGEL